LIEEHRTLEMEGSSRASRLKQLVPTVGTFHTRLPLRQAFELYNQKHHLTKRKHIQISFNEVRKRRKLGLRVWIALLSILISD
jgi:IMP and pyridine-specific 5'-nucleotidase